MGLKFALVGGDLRNVKLASILAAEGCTVYTYGISHSSIGTHFNRCSELSEAVTMGDFIIGPMPFTVGGSKLNAPLHTSDIGLDAILQAVPKGKVIMAGKVPPQFLFDAAAKGIRVVDILQREDMAILNAIPTAEGAIQIAMEEIPVTIHRCKTLVLGLGKVGSALAKRLKALGAEVTVCVRKSRDVALAESFGYGAITFDRLTAEAGHFTVIYNTVPELVIDETVLRSVSPETLIVDLASSPGGVDFGFAKECGIKTVQALSLPGKVAPETSAETMSKVIFNILKELAGEAVENVN